MEKDIMNGADSKRLWERATFITEPSIGPDAVGVIDNLDQTRQESAANLSANVDNPANMSRGFGQSTSEDVNIGTQKLLFVERDFYSDDVNTFDKGYDIDNLQRAPTTDTATDASMSANSEHLSFPGHNHDVTSYTRDSVACVGENETKTMEGQFPSHSAMTECGPAFSDTDPNVDKRHIDLDLLSQDPQSQEIPITMENTQNHAIISDCGYTSSTNDPQCYDEPMMLSEQNPTEHVSVNFANGNVPPKFCEELSGMASGVSTEIHQGFVSNAADISVPTTSDLANMMMSTDDISDFPLHSDNDSAHPILDTCSLSSEVDLNHDQQPFHTISTGLFDSVQSNMMSCPSENDLESHHSMEAPPSELSNDASNYLPDLGGDNSSTYTMSEADPEERLEPLNYELQQGYRILREIMSESNKSISWPFTNAVDDTLDGCQEYYEIVKQPIWLKKIRSKFDSREYSTITEFVADMRLMLENCYRFNGPDHAISKKGQRLETMMEQKLALLSRELREKTSIGATSGRPEENQRITGTRRRKAIVPHDSTALLNQLRLEAQEREREARRQLIQDRKQAQEAAQQELVDWEDRLLRDGRREQLNAMWEIPQIGHFLFLCASPLNIGEVMHWELERCFLMPRESSTMQKVMTTLLSTPYQRTRLDRKPMMPYNVWEEKLRTRLRQWYKMLHDANNDIKKIIIKLGLEEKFFQVLGAVSPLEKRSFHDLSFYQRVWIVKGLCDWCLETQDSLREAIEAQPILEQREYDLGVDHEGNTYLHFPQFCGADLRIYRKAPPIIEKKSPRRERSKSPKKTPSRSRRRVKRKTSPSSVPVTPRSRDRRLRQNPRQSSQFKTTDTGSDTDATADDAATQQSSQTDLVTSDPESDLDTSGRDSGISEQDSDLDESRSQSSRSHRSGTSRGRSSRKDKSREPAVNLDMLIGTTPARLTRSAMRNLTQAFSTNSTPSASREGSPSGSSRRGRKRPKPSLVSHASRETSPSVCSTRSGQKSRDVSPVSKSRRTPSRGSARKKISPRSLKTSAAVNLEEKFNAISDSKAVDNDGTYQNEKQSVEIGQGDCNIDDDESRVDRNVVDVQKDSPHCDIEQKSGDKNSVNPSLSPASELPPKNSVDNIHGAAVEEINRTTSSACDNEASQASRDRRESTGFTPLNQGASSSSFGFIPIPLNPNGSPDSKAEDDDESLASTISAVDPNYCPPSPFRKDKVNSPVLSEDSTNLSGISDVREKPQSVLLGNVISLDKRLGDDSSDTSECVRMFGAFKNVGPDEKSVTSQDPSENDTDIRGEPMDLEGSSLSGKPHDSTLDSSTVSGSQELSVDQSALVKDVVGHSLLKSSVTSQSPQSSQSNHKPQPDDLVNDNLKDNSSAEAMDTSQSTRGVDVRDSSLTRNLSPKLSPPQDDTCSEERSYGKDDGNAPADETSSDVKSETVKTEIKESSGEMVINQMETKSETGKEMNVKEETTVRDEVKDEKALTEDQLKQEVAESEPPFEEVLPEIGPFELVVDNIDSLRALIAKFDEVEKTLQQKTMRPPARRGSVTELRSRLAYLLEELQPWEQKLLSLGKKALNKMKKEQETYVEEPEKEEIKDVWESEESGSEDSAESEAESNGSEVVMGTKATGPDVEVGVTTRGGAKRRKQTPGANGKKPKLENEAENQSPSATPNILQKSRTSMPASVSKSVLGNLKLTPEQAKGSAIAFIGNQPVLLQTNQLAELKNNNMVLAQLVNSQNQGLKLVGKQKVGSQTAVTLLAANTGASASSAGNSPMLLTTQNPAMFQQKPGAATQKVQLKITSPVGKGVQTPKGSVQAKVMISGSQQVVLAGSQQLVLDSQGQLRVLQPAVTQQLVAAGAAMSSSVAASTTQQPPETEQTIDSVATMVTSQAGKTSQNSGQVQCVNYPDIRQLPVSVTQKLIQDQKLQQQQANTKPIAAAASVTSNIAMTTAVTPSAFTNLLQAGRLPGTGAALLKPKSAQTEASSIQQALKNGSPSVMQVKSPVAITPTVSTPPATDAPDLTQSPKSSKASRYATNVTVKTLLEKKIARQIADKHPKLDSETDTDPVEVIDLCHSPSRPGMRETSPKPQPSTSVKPAKNPNIASVTTQPATIGQQHAISPAAVKTLTTQLSPASRHQQLVQAGLQQQIQVVQGPGGQLMLQGAPPGTQVKFVQTPTGPKLQVFQNAPSPSTVKQPVQLASGSTQAAQGLVPQVMHLNQTCKAMVTKATVTMAPVAVPQLVTSAVVPATTTALLARTNSVTQSKVVISQSAATVRAGTKLVQVGSQGVIPLTPQVAAQLQVAIAKKQIVDNAVKAVITSVNTSLPTANIKVSSPFQMPSRRSHRPVTNTTSAMKVPIPAVPSQHIPLTSQAISVPVTAGQTPFMSSVVTPTLSAAKATTVACAQAAVTTSVVDLTESDIPMDTSELTGVSSTLQNSTMTSPNSEVMASADLTMPAVPQDPVGHLTTAVSAVPSPIVTPKANVQQSPGQPKNMGLRLTPQSILTPAGTVHGVVVPHGVALSQPILQQLKKISKVQGLSVFQQTDRGSLQQVFAGSKVVGAEPARPDLAQNLEKAPGNVAKVQALPITPLTGKSEVARSITFSSPEVPQKGIKQQAATAPQRTSLNHVDQPTTVVHHQVNQGSSLGESQGHPSTGSETSPALQQNKALSHTAMVQTTRAQPLTTVTHHMPTSNHPLTVRQQTSNQPRVTIAAAAIQQDQVRPSRTTSASPSATIVQPCIGGQQPVMLQPVQQSAILQQLQQAVRVSQPSVIQALTPARQKQVLLQQVALQTQQKEAPRASAVQQASQPLVAIQQAATETKTGVVIPRVMQEKAAVIGNQIVQLPTGQRLVQINQAGQQIQLSQAAQAVIRQQTPTQQVPRTAKVPVQPAQVSPVVLAAANAQKLLQQQVQAAQVASLPSSVVSIASNPPTASTLVPNITTQTLTQQQMIQLLQAQQKQLQNVQNTPEQQPVSASGSVVKSPAPASQALRSPLAAQATNTPAKLVVFNVNGKLMTAQGVPVNLTQGLVKVGNQVIGAQAGISRTTVTATTSPATMGPHTVTASTSMPTQDNSEVTGSQSAGGLQMLANAAGIETPAPMEVNSTGGPSGLEVLANVANNTAMGLPQD